MGGAESSPAISLIDGDAIWYLQCITQDERPLPESKDNITTVMERMSFYDTQ
jgi:hypothetical protein